MRFSLKHNMKMHIKTHTREGLYKCRFCDYQTVQRNNMKNHESAHSKMGHKPTKDPEITLEQQISRPGTVKGKYTLGLETKQNTSVQRESVLEQLNEMGQSANNSTTVNDSNKESSKSEHDELT